MYHWNTYFRDGNTGMHADSSSSIIYNNKVWGWLGHPEWGKSILLKSLKSHSITVVFECVPQTSSISIMWKLGRNANALNSGSESKTQPAGPSNACVHKPSGGPDAGWSVRTTALRGLLSLGLAMSAWWCWATFHTSYMVRSELFFGSQEMKYVCVSRDG